MEGSAYIIQFYNSVFVKLGFCELELLLCWKV